MTTTAPPGSPALSLCDVGKVYPGSPPVESVRGVTLQVYPGELVALVGPSGSGKTTLLHLAAGLERPTSGSVAIAGQDLGVLSDREMAGLRAHRVGVVFQQFFLLEALSAVENVATGLLYQAMAAARRRDIAMTVLDLVGLAHRAGHRPGQLSGGEQQRVAIARALAGRPQVLLADEPTGQLDSETAKQIMRLLRTVVQSEGVTALVATHDPGLIDIADSVLVLEDGTIKPD